MNTHNISGLQLQKFHGFIINRFWLPVRPTPFVCHRELSYSCLVSALHLLEGQSNIPRAQTSQHFPTIIMISLVDYSTHPPRAPELLHASSEEKKPYWDRSNYDSIESQMKALQSSKTLYIGNLTFSTRSSHLHALFSMVGPVSNVVMGLDRIQKTPCGFAFVEYVRRTDALNAVSYLSGTKLDGRPIRVELDAGFKPGRQYGRGSSGRQVRDDRRRGSIDPARSSSKSPRGVMGSNRWPTPQSADQSPGNKRASDDTYDLQQESAKKVRVSDNDVNDPNSTSLVE